MEVAIEEVSAWPNPTSGDSQVRITSMKAFEAELMVYNYNGSPLSKKDIKVNRGTTDLSVNLENLPKGIYLVKIHANGFESQGLKMIKE